MLKDIVKSAKNILILLPEAFCFDTVCAAYGLAQTLLEQKFKVTIGSSREIPKEFERILNKPAIQKTNELQKKEVILSLNLRKGTVESVKWREAADRIQFVITPEVGDFEYNDVDLETTGGIYDLFITIGSSTLESLGQIFSKNPEAYADVKIVNIDINPKNTKYGNVQVIRESKSLSNLTLELIEENGWEVNKDVIQTLFQGIFWSNEGFRKDNDLEQAVKTLVSRNLSLVEVVSGMFDSISVAELRYLGKIISNLKIFSDDLVVSRIPAKDIQGVNLDRILYPEINIVSRVKGQRAVIILSEYEPQKMQVRIYSKQVDVFQLFAEFSPVGNSQRVLFQLDGNLDESEKKLLEKFSRPSITDTKLPEAKKEPISIPDTDKQKSKPEPLKKAARLPQAIEAPPITPMQPQQAGPFPSQVPTQPLQPSQWR